MGKQKITVLGAGLIGKAIVTDMARHFELTVVDLSEKNLIEVWLKNPRTKIYRGNILKNSALLKQITEMADLVISAVPGAIGYETLQKLIAMKKDVVDISFMAEDPMTLNEEAERNGVRVVFDAGVCPGLSDIVAMRMYKTAREAEDKMISFRCYVGGLPKIPTSPWFYKTGFSAESVVDEYLRPARHRIDGEDVLIDPLGEPEPEILSFGSIGALAAFPTDGIRSLAKVLPDVAKLEEMTLRDPRHYQYMRNLKLAGSLNSNPEFIAKVKKAWAFGPEEEDVTVMRLIARSAKGRSCTVNLIDEARDGFLSMPRTTAYTATGIAGALLTGNYLNKPGVYPPGMLGEYYRLYNFIINHLRERDVLLS